MKYLVSVAGREIEVEVDGERVSVGGTGRTATLRAIAGTPSRQLLLDVLRLRSQRRAVDQDAGALDIGQHRQEGHFELAEYLVQRVGYEQRGEAI